MSSTFARNLRIETRIVESRETAQAIVEFARRQQITQILLLRPQVQPWTALFQEKLVSRVVRLAKDIRITVVAR